MSYLAFNQQIYEGKSASANIPLGFANFMHFLNNGTYPRDA
jgi:hypothetical protein